MSLNNDTHKTCYEMPDPRGGGCVREDVKLQRTEQHAAGWTHMLACCGARWGHTMRSGIHKEEAAPQGRNQPRRGVIKLKTHGHCKVYEGFSRWKQLHKTHLAAATSATWTSFISRGTVYDTADDLTAEVATGEAPRRVWWLLRWSFPPQTSGRTCQRKPS